MGKSNKGANLERKICGIISSWLTEGRMDDCLWRSSNSGGRATIRNRKGKGTTGEGDIVHTRPEGRPFTRLVTCELKSGYSGQHVSMVLDKPSTAAKQTYETWIEQVLRGKEMSGTPYWLLIHKRDRRQALAFMPNELWKELADVCPLLKACKPAALFKFEIGGQSHLVNCVQLETFLDVCTAKGWKIVSKRYKGD